MLLARFRSYKNIDSIWNGREIFFGLTGLLLMKQTGSSSFQIFLSLLFCFFFVISSWEISLEYIKCIVESEFEILISDFILVIVNAFS